MAHRVYISASTQMHNVGVLDYGTEQDRMMILADRVKYWLETQKGKFAVFRNQKGWTIQQTVKDCNSLSCAIFVDNHTNASKIEEIAGDGGAEGTETFYCGASGVGSESHRLATLLQKYVAPLSIGKERPNNVRPDNQANAGGIYVVTHTDPPAALIEHIFHTNKQEVVDFLKRMDEFAKAEAKGICEFFNETWVETLKPGDSVLALVDKLFERGAITDKSYWLNGLLGKSQLNPEYVQLVLTRLIK